MSVHLSHWFHEPFGCAHHFSVSFYSSFPVLKMNWGKKREFKQKSSQTVKTRQLVPNRRTTVGMSNTEYPFPWNHEVLLLDNTNISTDVLYILQNACYLFVSIYLFIWFVALNAYLCIPIILYASGPYVKAVLLLRLSSNIILCPQPVSAHVDFFFSFVFKIQRKVPLIITLLYKLDNNYWKRASSASYDNQ